MKYAFFQFNSDIRLLIDAEEYEFPLMKLLDMEKDQRKHFMDSIKIIQHNYKILPLYLVYGAFLPNNTLNSDEVINHIELCKDHVLMTFRWTTTFTRQCETIGIVDIATFLPQKQLRLLPFWIPIAALVHAPSISELTNDGAGVSYFLRYEDLNAFDNLLNRPGIFCFKNVSDESGKCSNTDWKKHIDEKKLLRIFNEIR